MAGFDDCQADALAVFVSEDKKGPDSGPVADLIAKRPGPIQGIFRRKRQGDDAVSAPRRLNFKRVLFSGGGKAGKTDGLESFRAAAGKAVGKCMDAGLSSLAVAVYPMAETLYTSPTWSGRWPRVRIWPITCSTRYKSEKKKSPLSAVTLVSESGMPEGRPRRPGHAPPLSAARH